MVMQAQLFLSYNRDATRLNEKRHLILVIKNVSPHSSAQKVPGEKQLELSI